MNTAVTETARVLNPLSTAISNGIVRSINKAFDVIMSQPSGRKKTINELAYSLRMEYPKESEDYVMNMAINMLKDAK